MNYQFFQYRLPIDGQPEDLNRYLAGHRVVAVRQHLVQDAAGGLLVFVVETTGPAELRERPSADRIDYKAILSDDDFALFSRLREQRKEAAAKDGVPVYAIFSNAQLAEMARQRVSTVAELGKIEGVGTGRVEKHGAAFLALIRAFDGKEGV